jgi:hypothetical protein
LGITYVFAHKFGLGPDIIVGANVIFPFWSWDTVACWTDGAIASDLDVEAMHVELRTSKAPFLPSVAVESKKLCAEDVEAWLDITRELECISIVVDKKLLISPETYS